LVMRHAVENGYGTTQSIAFFDVQESEQQSRDRTLEELTCLVSERVRYEVGTIDLGQFGDPERADVKIMLEKLDAHRVDAGVDVFALPTYTVKTEEKIFAGSWSMAGKFEGDSFQTPSIVEAWLALSEFSSTSPMEPRPQMLDGKMIGSRVFNLKEIDVQLARRSYQFNAEVNGAKLDGKFRANDLRDLRVGRDTEIVTPVYNKAVMGSIMRAVEAALDVASRVASKPDGQLAGTRFLRPTIAYLVQIAHGISPAFRAEIHDIMRDRATRNLSYDESVRMRAMLAQRYFAVFADAFAMYVFFEVQGYFSGNKGYTLNLDSLLADPEVMRTFLDIKTDRLDS